MGDMDYSDLGREIGEKIEKFVNSREIKDLQENIKNTVEKTMQEVGRSVKEAADFVNKNVEIQWDSPHTNDKGPSGEPKTGSQKSAHGNMGKGFGGKEGPYRGFDSPYGSGTQAGRNVYEKWDRTQTRRSSGQSAGQRNPYVYNTAERTPRKAARQLPAVRRPKGSVSGVLLSVFGVFMAISGFFGSISGYSWLLYSTGLGIIRVLPFGITLGVGMIGLLMTLTGSFLRKRVRRFKKYVRQMGEGDFYPIRDLAKGAERKEKAAVKDLKKMIKRKWFPEGHLDEQETCFMLTDEAYGIYLNAQEELKRRKEEAERLKEEQERMEQDPVLKQLKITVEEGKEYIRRIREVNNDIPGEEISQKLYRLEKVTARIFDHVKENPDKLPDIRRFMNYYLPTTLKLVESYYEFSIQPVQGENITTAEKEIEEMLDEINTAFERMFDKLFADDAMDISTDISVMSSMLKQEGLLENEFGRMKEKEEKAGAV